MFILTKDKETLKVVQTIDVEDNELINCALIEIIKMNSKEKVFFVNVCGEIIIKELIKLSKLEDLSYIYFNIVASILEVFY